MVIVALETWRVMTKILSENRLAIVSQPLLLLFAQTLFKDSSLPDVPTNCPCCEKVSLEQAMILQALETFERSFARSRNPILYFTIRSLPCSRGLTEAKAGLLADIKPGEDATVSILLSTAELATVSYLVFILNVTRAPVLCQHFGRRSGLHIFHHGRAMLMVGLSGQEHRSSIQQLFKILWIRRHDRIKDKNDHFNH